MIHRRSLSVIELDTSMRSMAVPFFSYSATMPVTTESICAASKSSRLIYTPPMVMACPVICAMASVSEDLYPKKMLGSAVKITIGSTISATRTASRRFTRNGAVSLTATAAAPCRPPAAAA